MATTITRYRTNQDGSCIFDHVDSAGTSGETFTFPFTADTVAVYNQDDDIPLTVAGVTIQPGQSKTIAGPLSSIIIAAVGGMVTFKLTGVEEVTRQVSFKKIKMNNPKTQIPLAVIIDDDGNSTTYTKLKPLMDQYGFKACSAAITTNIGTSGYMTLGQLQELYAAGWEIMSHSKTHPHLADLTQSQIEDELKSSKDTLGAYFDVKGLVYPYESNNALVRTIAKKYYDYAFAGWGLVTAPLHSSLVTRITVGGPENYTYEQFKYYIDTAIAENKLVVFALHSVYISDPQWDIFTQLMAYLDSLSTIRVVTASEAMDSFGNLFETWNENTGDYFVIGADNEAYSTGIFRNYEMRKPNGITESSPVSAFEKGRSTIIPFYATDNFGQGAGILINHRDLTTDDLSFQEWIPSDMKSKWLRSWNTSNSSWFAWRKYYPDKYVTYDSAVNARTATDLISTFPQGLTVTIITNTTGFPIARAGMLHTYRFDNADNGYQWQEYHVYGKPWVYRRTTNTTTGDWLGWTRILVGTQTTYNMSTKTIPANSCLDLSVPFYDVKDYSILYASPGATALEANVGFNIYYQSNDNCYLRLINPTASPITLAARTWTITMS